MVGRMVRLRPAGFGATAFVWPIRRRLRSDEDNVRLRQGYGGQPSRLLASTRPANRSRERSERLAKVGGEGGNRTHPSAQSAEATILKTVTTTRHVSLSAVYPTVPRATSDARYTIDTPGNPDSTSPMTAAR